MDFAIHNTSIEMKDLKRSDQIQYEIELWQVKYLKFVCKAIKKFFLRGRLLTVEETVEEFNTLNV